MATLKALLKKLFKIREKTQYERKQRFYSNNPSLGLDDIRKRQLEIRGINAARALEELKEARRLEEER